jgi:hypothetical protein
MRLHNQYREFVGFLRLKDDLQVKATAFLVGVPLTRDAVAPYVVTAAHVVQKARSESRELTLRVNKVGGGWDDIAIPSEAWAEREGSDVAAAEVDLRNGVHDVRTVPLEILADDGMVAQYDIGEGDEVFMPGLFTSVPGETRDQPIVRFGHIALGLQDAIRINIPSGSVDVDAYLIETRSWGGESGSPVFVSFMGPQGYAQEREGAARILGILHGHYEIERKVKFRRSEADAVAPLNAGIAVVIPAQKIIDLLTEEERFVKNRADQIRKIDEARPAPVPDMVDDEAAPDEFQEFENLTRRLTKVSKKELDEKRRDES